MYFYKEDLINVIVPDKPDPSAAKVLQETLGGRGQTPSRNGGTLEVTAPPEGFPLPFMPELPSEHSPGLHDLNN
ncbi:manganese containing catalase [Fontibacillus phaseoli]|uniref:Manganese containing catalase n=1 Tax=Fontibacillus phaseoli TaxID=1416533 RepID=A0A369BQZ1_9BACL|nr:manganese containing catalase [Fontibacillus phaseoli]